MVVVCPICFCKYFIDAEAIGKEKLVRCTTCGAVWQQASHSENAKKKQHVFYLVKWTFFWFIVFVTIFSLFFAKDTVIKIWPPIGDFYEAIGTKNESNSKVFAIKNVSNFFIMKNGVLYMGLKVELVNTSNEVRAIPGITISLKNDDEKNQRYRKSWTHDLTYKKLLPNQKVVFETELQSVPYNNLICSIELDAL